MNKEKRTELVSFRLTKSEYQPYSTIIKSTNLNKTDFFRSIFLEQQYSFNVKENKPTDYNKLLFLFNKTSNNINQIAHRLNADYQKGFISSKLYESSLNQLITLESLLKGAIDAC